MINTISKFYYGYEVTSSNKYLDINEGSGEITAEIQTGSYTLEDLAQAVEDALNEIGTYSYTVTVNRSTRILTIASSGTVSLLCSTGSSVALGVAGWSNIGFNASDRTSITSATGNNAIGTVYTPQYKLQDYVSHEDNRKLRSASKNESASGKVQVQSFGTDRMFEFSIKFATDIYQPASGPITNNSSGVANLRSFMQYISQKKTFEFMPDKDTPSTYFRCILESSEASGDGMGYKITEQFAKNLVGYYETGLLKVRIVED